MFVLIFQFAALFLFVLIMFFAAMALQGELARRKRLEREKTLDYPSRIEFDMVYSQYVGVNTLLWVLFLIALLGTFGFYSTYESYLENRKEFSSWIESKFDVPVDEDRADKVECYLEVLHYPQKGGSGVIPYPTDPVCDEKTFNQKKASLDLVDKSDVMNIWSLGTMIAWFVFFMVLIIARLLLKPKYDWTKLNQAKLKQGAGE